MSTPPLQLWCTAKQAVVPFEPGPVVTMYTCGITPYDSAHLGHAAVYVTYDVLQRRLIDRGYAYQAGGAVYFDVGRFAEFGTIGNYSREEMLALARERGGDVDNPAKRDPLDFVLWQPSAPDEPSWDTLWGPGRPGWHIECSALALRELGSTIDLHGGGSDLIFPHHEC